MQTMGYVKLHRSIMDNPIWNDKPFSKGQAWIDLIMKTNHTCKEVWGFQDTLCILRGQFISSNYKLAKDWGWSETTVRQFIKLLKKSNMITFKSFNKYTLFEITNYSAYQSIDSTLYSDISNAQKTHKKRASNAQATLTNNELNNELKNEKKCVPFKSQNQKHIQKEITNKNNFHQRVYDKDYLKSFYEEV